MSVLNPEATPDKALRIFATLVRDQEVEGSNPFAPTTLSRSHIDLHCNCVLLFNAQNLSRLVNHRLLFVGGKYKTKTHLGGTLFPPLNVGDSSRPPRNIESTLTCQSQPRSPLPKGRN
jgi:hypothetical protein